jgi:hypothetical protein
LAEDRASQHLTDKTNLKGDLERLQTLSETTERLRQSTFCKNNQELMKYLEQVFHESHANQRTREISTSLSRLDDVHTRKVLADRASQVAELVSLVQQAESREDMLYEVFDSLLETSDMQMQQLIDIEVDLSCEREQLSRTSVESRTESKTVEQLLDQQLREKDLECQIAQQLTSLTQAELSEALKIRSSLEQTLMDSSEAYQELSRVCKSKSKDLEKARAELENSSSKITELINSIQVLESQVVQLNDQIRRAHEDHSLATEAWNQKQYELQSTLKKLENNIREEKAKYNKLSGELMLTRQAEASLRGELEQ